MFASKAANPQSKSADSTAGNPARQHAEATRPFGSPTAEVGDDRRQGEPGKSNGELEAPRPTAPSVPPMAQGGLRSPAASLDADNRRFFETRFYHDFSKVQIHTGVAAARSAQAIQARAFTVGQHIVFGAGETPTTNAGRRLLAHELVHVVQQHRGSVPGARRDSADALEAEADRAASAFGGSGPIHIQGAGPIAVARQVAPPPQALSFLTAADIAKLQAFGPSDYQESLNALQEILSKTKGFTTAGAPQQYVDIRQAAGELRAFLDYLRNPAITGVKVVPSQMGNRTPDLYLREVGGREFRGEVVNITQASKDIRPDLGVDKQGRSVPRIPKADAAPGAKPAVELPTNEFKLGQIKTAISAKISPKTAGGATQLDALNPATQASGRPMATGGDVVLEVLEGSASKAELDGIITSLLPKLKLSSARRVLISIVDSADPSVGRKVFEYVRGEGDVFVGTVRAAYYRPGAVPGGTAGPAGAAAPPSSSPSVGTVNPPGEAPVEASPGPKSSDPVKPVEALKPGEGAGPAGAADTLKAGEGGVAAEAAAGKPKLRLGSGPKGRLMVNLGVMVGVTALDMLNRAQMAKVESARAVKWIEQTAAGPETSAAIAKLVQQQRMSIARRQLNGQTVYATIAMKLTFTNDVIDTHAVRDISITDSDKSSFMSSVMSHGAFTGAEGKDWYVDVSLPLDQVELSEVERAQLSLDKHDADVAALQTIDPDRLSTLGEQRVDLLARLEQAKVREAAAKRAAIGQSTVIADAAKRAQQQEEIAEELRQQAAKHPPSAQSNQPQSPPASGPSLLPQAPLAGPQLLPGAPTGSDPVALAAQKVAQSRAWAQKLEAAGMALRGRLSSSSRPSQQDIDAFLTEEHNWRLMTKWWMNHYTQESRAEAVTGLGEVLDQYVPKLQQLRVQLGGG